MKLSKKMAAMMAAAALLSGVQMAAAYTEYVDSTPSKWYTTDVDKNVNTGDGEVGRYYLYTNGWDAVTAPDRQKTNVTFSHMNFTDNTVKNTGTTAKTGDTGGGAAVFIKGADVTFNDVGFTGNTVTSESGALSNGGAVFVDSTRNNHNYDASVTFNVSKDMAYTGNKVTGAPTYSETYGNIATTSGGFLYMDRGTTANFNIDEGATLTIGKEGEKDVNTDSIASSIKRKDQTYSENAINKNGKGTLTVNGSMSGYHGDLNVKEGTMNINQSLAGDANISVSDGATLNLKKIELSSQSGTIPSVVDPKGVLTTYQLAERNGSLVAETGSKVTATTITLKDKSSMKVETGATVTADSVAVADDATLKAESHSNLDVKQVKVEDPNKTGHVQLMGDFSGKLVDSNGQALTAEQTKNVMAKATGDNSRVDIDAKDGKSATSLLQGNDGTFTIQRKDYENGGQTTVLGSYSKDGTYNANGHDMTNIGQLSAKSLSVGQITDVETAINTNKDAIQRLDGRVDAAETAIKTNATNIAQNTTDIRSAETAIKTNATNIAQNTTDIRSAEKAIDTNANGIAQNKAGIQRLDGRVNKVGANAAALAALHPLDYDASDKWNVAAGVGNYGDANAMAIGAFYRPNEDVMLNMAGSFGSGENMVNAGISFKVGQSGMKAAKAEGADVKALQEKVEAQDKEIKELREMVEKLVAKA